MAALAVTLGACFALAGGWIGPGLALAGAFELGRDRLERVVLAVAIGRILLAVVTLVATACGAASWLVAWGVLGGVAGIVALRRSRALPRPEAGTVAALAVAAACALLLVHAIVFRSAIENGGVLPFFGRDSANDPFVYGAYAQALRDLGPPLANPFAGGGAVPGSYAEFAVLAGLASIASTPIVDLVYRVLPLFECSALAATAVALVRALGAPRLAWLLAPIALLAGDPGPVASGITRALGLPTHAIDSFALFGPYLLAMNPITPGLQALFCALLLLARSPRRGEAWIAGALVGALIEIKLFLWAPALAGLVAAALLRPPALLRSALRHASAAAVLASLPSLLDKARWALHGAAQDQTGLSLCVACLPRYLVRAAWGDGELSFAIFDGNGLAALSPRLLLASLGASALIAAIALGARALALPELLRGAREGAAVHRVLLFASVVGGLLALTITTPPHNLNAAQFAWVAVFGFAPLLAIACARWAAAGRVAPLVLATLLAVPGTGDAILRLGYGAPQRFSISAAERELCAALARASAPGDVVLEPSMIVDTDRPSPIPLLAGRPVYLSLLSAVGNLPAGERDRRFARLVDFFAGHDESRARQALAESGARFVFVPAGIPAPALPRSSLSPIAENAAGRIFRVDAAGSASLAP